MELIHDSGSHGVKPYLVSALYKAGVVRLCWLALPWLRGLGSRPELQLVGPGMQQLLLLLARCDRYLTSFFMLQTEGTATLPFRLTFSNIEPGSWTFRVTALNKNGRTSAAITAPATVKGALPSCQCGAHVDAIRLGNQGVQT